MRKIRYRLARLLLGYTPMVRPDKDGAYILVVETKGDWHMEMITPTSSLTMDVQSAMPRVYGEAEDLSDFSWTPGGMTGTFSGTIGGAV